MVMKQAGNEDIKTSTKIIFNFSFWVINIKQRASNIQKSRISIVLLDKNHKQENIQSFFDRKEEKKYITDIIKILNNLFCSSKRYNMKLEESSTC